MIDPPRAEADEAEGIACLECGSPVVLTRGPGRFRRYRGEDGYEIPADLEVPTCATCGALWMDTVMVKRIGQVFEAERKRRQLSRPRAVR